MSRPAYDAAELARSLLAELPQNERAELLTGQFLTITDLAAIVQARNVLTDHAAEIIADRYVDDLLSEDAA